MPKQSRPIRFKVVVVGDSQCGKTSLCVALDGGIPRSDWQRYGRFYYDARVVDLKMGGTEVQVAFWDTNSNEDYYTRLRPLCYPGSHVALICYSLTSTHPMEGSVRTWAEEIRHWDPEGEIQFSLVGCKCDERDGRNPANTIDQGKWCSQLVGAHRYMECSAKTLEGIQELRAQMLRAAYIAYQARNETRDKRGCVLA